MDHKISQNKAILGCLILRGSITPLQAMKWYRCYRLGARIYDLRKKGYNIASEMVKLNKKHFCRYTLV